MPFVRPSLSDLTQRIKSDLSTRILGTPNVLRRAVISVIAQVMAGAVHLLYGYVDWLSKQVFPDTAEAPYLYRIGAWWGIFLKPATYNSGGVTFTGAPGSVLTAATTVLVRSDGVLFNLSADVTIPAGSGSSVTAAGLIVAQDPGAAPACDPGTILTLQSPAAGVSSSVVVDQNGIFGGFDVETDASFRARLLYRIGNPPRGGNDGDYVVWALAYVGVTRAWPYPLLYGPSTVGLTFVMDNQTSSIAPSSGQLAAFQAYINQLKPSHADVTVFAPATIPLNPTIHLSPDTPTIRAAVQAELDDLLITEGGPSTTVLLSHIRDRIGTAAGVNDYALVSPTADQTYGQGQVPVVGTITWQ